MSVHGKKSMSASLIGESEEDFDIVCGPCSTEDQRLEAVGFCENCHEHLCSSCVKYHKKMAILRKHVIQGMSTNPNLKGLNNTGNKSRETTDPLTKRCTRHPEEVIKFYCNTHQTLGCGVCIPLDHRHCIDVSYIRDISGGIEDCPELKEVRADLRRFLATLKFDKSRAEYNAEYRKETYSKTVSDIKQLRKNINKVLDELGTDILKRASELAEKDVNISNETTSDCDYLITETETAISDLEEKLILGHRSRLFVAMKQARERMFGLTDGSRKRTENIKTKYFSFQPDDKMTDIISKLCSLGNLQLVVSSPADIKARYVYDINVKTTADRNDCGITGAVVLHDGRLAVTDFDNMSVKLINVTQKKVTSQLTLSSPPRYLTVVSEDQLAVILKDEKKILILSISDTLSKVNCVSVPIESNGFVFCSDRFILAGEKSNNAINIVGMSGNLIKQIDSDCDGNKLFAWPCRLTVSPNHKVMYVGDFEKHNVTCVDMDGEVIQVFTHDQLIEPEGIAVDMDGTVYVCSYDTHTVHQLTPTGNLIQILLHEEDGLEFPSAIAHSDRDRKLYVSCESNDPNFCNNIKVYQLN